MKMKSAVWVLAPLGLAAIAAAAFYGTKVEGGKGACPAPLPPPVADKLAPARQGRDRGAASGKICCGRRAASSLIRRARGKNSRSPISPAALWRRTCGAAWCAPCRDAMLALDKLQAAAAGPKIRGRRRQRPHRPGPSGRPSFLTRSASRISPATPTIPAMRSRPCGSPARRWACQPACYRPAGCEVGLVAGPANWGSPEALAAVKVLQGG